VVTAVKRDGMNSDPKQLKKSIVWNSILDIFIGDIYEAF
jgi:hypothetical protein